MWRKTPYDDEIEEKDIQRMIDNAFERGYKTGLQALQAQADCNTCDKAVRDRVGVIGCAKFDSKPTVAIPSAEQKWIPVSERLPEESLNSVIGWDAFRERCVFVQYLDGQFQVTGKTESFDIKAWMPLPEPYEEVIKDV